MAKDKLFNTTGHIKCVKCGRSVASDKLKKHRCQKDCGKPRTKVSVDAPPPGTYRSRETKKVAERAWLVGACLKCGKFGHDVVECRKVTYSD